MKIAFFEIKGWEKPYLKKELKNHTLEFYQEPLSSANVDKIRDFEMASVFIYSKIDEKVLKKLPQLKLITTRSTGFGHIDLKVCQKKKITVCNVPFYGENTVAEHTFALILSLSRNIHKSYVRTLRNDFSIEGLKGFDLKGKTLGVIGTGHIGACVIKMAKGFDMNVLAFDVIENKELAKELDFQYVAFDQVLKNSDIITLHVPYNKNTHHLINKQTIKKIKKGAVLINTARGGIADTEALIWALDQGILSGLGLDVLEGEKLIKEEKQLLYDKKNLEVLAELVKGHILLSKDNVVFTPHIAFYSEEALIRIIETTIENIKQYLLDKPENIVIKK